MENHGRDQTGQLTWGMLVDTMYGVGSFLQEEGCWSGEWTIVVEGLGNIGSGFIGAMMDEGIDGTLAGMAMDTD